MKLLILTQVIDRQDSNLGFFHRWVEEFAKHVSNLEVVCLREGKHELPVNVRIHSLGKERGGGRFSYVFRFYRMLWKLRGTYDAVFIHMNSEYLLLGGLFWKTMGKRTVLWHTHKSMTLIHRVGEKLVDIVVTASPESYRLKSKKVRVLGHGIDTEAFCPKERTPDGIFRILSTGRIARTKGLHTIIDALGQISGKEIATELLILGGPMTEEDTKYQQELESQTRKLSISKNVHFVGTVSHQQIIPYLQNADVFINCSSTGSLDKAVLEAMSAGVLVLTSNDGLKSTLGTLEEELMFKNGDAQALAQKLLWLHSIPQGKKKALSENLRRIVVEGHSLEKLIPRLIELL